jgi:6-phosphogluconate dehydrogenase
MNEPQLTPTRTDGLTTRYGQGDEPVVALVGLGKMGSLIAARLVRAGFRVVGYDLADDRSHAAVERQASLVELVAALPAPRMIWLMLPPGAATNAVLDELLEHVEEGDLVIDGGNSDHRESRQQGMRYAKRGVDFLDAGVSGGVWGGDDGFGITVGGNAGAVARAENVFTAVAAAGAYAHVGPSGSGHYVKMIHNAVEYGLMQAYGEGYELLEAAADVDVGQVLNVWQNGCSIRSWLLSHLAGAYDANPGFTGVKGWAADSGMARWATEQALLTAVPIPVIAAALFARFASRQEESPAMQAVAALREQIGGHSVQAAG